MRLLTAVRLLRSGRLSLVGRVLKTSNEFYRLCFVRTALAEGLYDKLRAGPAHFNRLCDDLESESSREGLRAWLQLGVSLGELGHSSRGYRLRGALSRKIASCSDDSILALLQEIVDHHYAYVLNTPSLCREQRRFPFNETIGPLIARSSRIMEPVIFEVVDETVSREGTLRLLEVGCGSGVYIQRSCSRNPLLTAVGLELQPQVAELARENMKAWGLESRVAIEACDVRNYQTESLFDLVTLHQNIYYFPVRERAALTRQLGKFLKPGGLLVLTTACQGGSPAVEALNVWASNTDGYGPLPVPQELAGQLREAGFSDVKSRRLIPFESFYVFFARRPAQDQAD